MAEPQACNVVEPLQRVRLGPSTTETAMSERLDDMPAFAADGAPIIGHPSTWREDVIAFIPALRAFAWSLSHNSADADDLVQDTLIKAWIHRTKFEPGTNLRAWLFTILRNTYYTAVVRKRREVADENGKHAATLSAAPTQDWSVAVHSLRAALQQLPHEHREALVLVGAAGMTYEEAAEICGCALGTIKSRVNRARARLLRIMDADVAEDTFAEETLGAVLKAD